MSQNSLRALLKAAKRRDVSPLLPKLELWLTSAEADTHWDVDWGLKDHWHPSQVSKGICPRLEVIQSVVGAPVVEGSRVEAGLLRIFKLGDKIHEMYQQDILGPMGLLYGMWVDLKSVTHVWAWKDSKGQRLDGEEEAIEAAKHGWLIVRSPEEGVEPFQVGFVMGTMPSTEELLPKLKRWRYLEYALYDPQTGMAGHCDGLIVMPDGALAILEIKSINTYGFDARKEARDDHLRQCLLYAHAARRQPHPEDPKLPHLLVNPRIGHVVFLYVNKNNSLEKEFWVEFDGDVIRPLLADMEMVNESKELKTLPPRWKACASNQTKTALYCPHCDACFAAVDGAKGYEQIAKRATAKE